MSVCMSEANNISPRTFFLAPLPLIFYRVKNHKFYDHILFIIIKQYVTNINPGDPKRIKYGISYIYIIYIYICVCKKMFQFAAYGSLYAALYISPPSHSSAGPRWWENDDISWRKRAESTFLYKHELFSYGLTIIMNTCLSNEPICKIYVNMEIFLMFDERE